MQLAYTITVELSGAHRQVIAAEIESVIERAAESALAEHLDPDDMNVAVEEAD